MVRIENDASNNFCCRGNAFTELLPGNDRGIHKQAHRLMRPTILLLLRVFNVMRKCLPCRCLAMKGGIYFTESRNDRKDIHTDTQTDGRDLWSTPLRWAQVP
jgi:hypothetical protein